MHSPTESTTLKDYSNGSIDYSNVANIVDSCSVSQTNSLHQEAYALTSQQQVNVHIGSSSKKLLVQCATAIFDGQLIIEKDYSSNVCWLFFLPYRNCQFCHIEIISLDT